MQIDLGRSLDFPIPEEKSGFPANWIGNGTLTGVFLGKIDWKGAEFENFWEKKYNNTKWRAPVFEACILFRVIQRVTIPKLSRYSSMTQRGGDWDQELNTPGLIF